MKLTEYPFPSPFFLSDVAFIDENVGWAVGAVRTEEQGSSPIVIFHTSDGGLTWEEQESGLEDGYLNTVVFTDGVTGYAVGQEWKASIPTLILYTQDGGTTWIKATLPEVFGGLQSIYFTETGTG